MEGNFDVNNALAVPKDREFRPFIKTFQIFKQLMPSLIYMNNSDIPSIKKICVKYKKML